jgi:PBP1b-binding outer membrane lipoprotein LpoB
MTKLFTALSLAIAMLAGCSEQTQEATTEAVKSAAEDTKVNAKKLGDAFEAGVDEFKDSPAAADDSPADADAVPESEEPK